MASKKKKIGPTLEGRLKDMLATERRIYTQMWKDHLVRLKKTPIAGLEAQSGFLSIHMLDALDDAEKALEKGAQNLVFVLRKRVSRSIGEQSNSTCPMHRASSHYALRVADTLLQDTEDLISAYSPDRD